MIDWLAEKAKPVGSIRSHCKCEWKTVELNVDHLRKVGSVGNESKYACGIRAQREELVEYSGPQGEASRLDRRRGRHRRS